MKYTKRQATMAAGILALSFAGKAAYAQAVEQRGGPAGPDTPSILVTTLSSTDRQLGPQMADELRKRLQSEHAMKELFVIPKRTINATLEASGYKADSALNSSDLMELSKQLRGEYVIDGSVSKSASGGVHLESRLLTKTGQQTLAQPLPAIDGKDAGDVAKNAEKAISDILKGIPSYKTCINDLRAAKYDQALVDARAGITAYPNSVLSRICMLNSYTSSKASPDSIISVANAILNLEPKNLIALGNLAEAYKAKGQSDKVIETNLRIAKADPSNPAVMSSVIQDLANSGAPDKALPLLDSLLKENPADPNMLSTKWKLQLAAKRYKDAIATGEQLVKIDTTQATADYYNRQIGAAQADSNSAGVLAMAAKAAQKFPSDASYQMIMAQGYAKAGQLQQSLQAARRATEINPKDANAWALALFAANSMKQADTVSAIAQKAIAAGVDKSVIGGYLLGPANAAVQKAQASKARADWQEALTAAQSVDAMAPTPQSAFLVVVSSFSIAADLVTEAGTLGKSTKKPEREQACTDTKQAEEMLTTTQTALPRGGAFNKEAAGQIVGGMSQLNEYIPQIKKALSCK